MAYSFEIGNASSEDITIVFNIGSGASNPRIKWDSSSSTLQVSNDGSTWEDIGYGSGGTSTSNTWQNPARIGDVRMWPDTTNSVPRWKYGSDPTSETDGYEFAGLEDFTR